MFEVSVKEKIFNSYLGRALGYIAISQGINGLATFSFLILFTRNLPRDEFGKASLLWLTVSVLSVFLDMRLNTGFCIRHYNVGAEERARNLYSILFYYLGAGIIFFFTLQYFSAGVEAVLQISVTSLEITVISLTCFFIVVGNFFRNLLLVTKQNRYYFLVTLFSSCCLVGSGVFFLLFYQCGYISYLYGYLFTNILLSVGYIAYLVRNFPPTFPQIVSTRNLFGLLRLSLPLVPDGLLLMVLAGADKYLLNIFHGLASVGAYSVAHKFSQFFNILFLMPLSQVLTPVLFSRHAKSIPEYKELLGKIFIYYWVFVSVFIVGLFTFFQELFLIIVGDQYAEMIGIVIIILLGQTIYGGASFLSCTILLKEKTHVTFLITLFSSAVNVALNLIFIPSYRITGAAVATLVSFVVQSLVILIFTQSLEKIDFDLRFLARFAVPLVTVSLLYTMIGNLLVPAWLKILLRLVAFAFFVYLLDRSLKLRQIPLSL